MDKKDQNSNEKLLKGLADFIAEGHALGAEAERLDDEIREVGLDPTAYVSRFKGLVEGEIAKYRAAIHEDRLKAESQVQALLRRVKERISRLSSQEQESWVARLEPRLAGAYFRNFKSASAADKSSMLEDLELLEALEKLAKEQEEK